MIVCRAISSDDVTTHHLEVGTYQFNRVQEFKYLDTLITIYTNLTQNNEIQEEIKTRIQTGNILD